MGIEGAKEQMANKKISLKDIVIPPISLGEVEPYGMLVLRQASFKAFADVANADSKGPLTDADLASALIEALVRKSNDNGLTNEEVASLEPTVRKRVIQEIIAAHDEWFKPNASATVAEEIPQPLEHGGLEIVEEYLASGFRAEYARVAGQTGKLLAGLSDRVRGLLAPSIAANLEASGRVSDLVKEMSQPRYAAFPLMRPSPREIKLPEIPRNPVYDTNDILGEVADQIGQMRELATATAEMQRTLNDTATAAVTEFSKGAEDTRKASRNGLWIAGATLLVSIMAVAVAIYLGHSQNSGAEAREAELRAQTERLEASEKNLAQTVEQLRQELAEMRAEAASNSPVVSKGGDTLLGKSSGR